MEAITPQQQRRLTDFFASRVQTSSNHKRSNGKNGSSGVLSKKKSADSSTSALSVDSVSDKGSESSNDATISQDIINNNNNMSSSTKKALTPGKRKLKNPGAASTTAAPSVSKRTRSTTKKTTTATTRSVAKSSISFGPRVGKLDFESAVSSTTTKTTIENDVISKSTTSTEVTSTVQESSTTSVTKSLNVSEIKEKLRGCKNLANLKQHLASINGCADKIKQFKSMKVPILSPVKPAYARLSPRKVASPEKFSLSGLTPIPSPLKAPHTPSKRLSSPYLVNATSSNSNSPCAGEKLSCSRKLFESSDDSNSCDTNNNSSTIKGSDAAIPAYRRFAYLSKTAVGDSTLSTASESAAKSEPESVQLPLPLKHKRLLDLFKRLDYFTWHYKKRQETCTFDKLKQKLELATRRTFDLPSLMKIITVLNGCGNEECKRWFQLEMEPIGGKNQLTITPLYPDHVKSIHSINMLLEREKGFHAALLELTKEEHLKFLAQMHLTLSHDSTVYNWHPMFQLDSVPDIEPDMSLIPKPQLNKSIKGLPPNQQSILNYFVPRDDAQQQMSVIGKEEEKQKPQIPEVNTQTEDRVKAGKLKGIPLHLLNKVRQKEAATKARLMFRPPEIDRELCMLARLPTIIRILDRYYQSTKAKSHTYQTVIRKVSESLKCTILLATQLLDYMLGLELRADPEDLTKRWIHKEVFSNLEYVMMDQLEYKLVFLLEQISTRVEHLSKQT